MLHQDSKTKETFKWSVQTGATDSNEKFSEETASGFLIGAGASIDYRAAALIHHSPGNEGGYFVGTTAGGKLFIQDFNTEEKKILIEKTIEGLPESYQINISGIQTEADYKLILNVTDNSNKEIGQLSYAIDKNKVNGNVALVSHPGKGKNTGAFWFNNWTLSGDKFDYDASHNSGPIITAQHTLSNEVLKINAQLMPVGKNDNDFS